MQRISVHISDETKQKIDLAVKANNKLESELIREAIDAGLKVIYPHLSSVKSLLKLAKMAKGMPFTPKEPTNVSEDTAKYAFGGER